MVRYFLDPLDGSGFWLFFQLISVKNESPSQFGILNTMGAFHTSGFSLPSRLPERPLKQQWLN